ncbi:glycosyltransferase family 4 protein [Parvularcula oceani]|uniref:glycosyltransferase family 4 protein n=1 Tax=Parvularcula oceani TaxID=1247963 RepID=UPI0004E1555C|nr:glycosyltransferase family 4 protein [Parvularcula oceani]
MSRLLLTTDCVGGVWRYSVDLGHALSARGWTVGLAAIGPSPSDDQRAEAEGLGLLVTGAPLDWEPGGEGGLLAGRAALEEAAHAFGADCVQLNQPAFGGPDWNLPVVAVAHSCVATWWRAVKGEAPPEEWAWHGQAMRRGLASADAALAPSAAFAAALSSAYPDIRQAEVVHNGTPLPPAAQLRTDRTDHILSAGRLWDEAKDLRTLDAAARGLGWPVTIAGSSEDPEGRRRAYPSLHPLGFLGQDEMRERHARAAAFVSTSLYEPFGLAVLEAAGYGTPLVLSDIPTFRELWEGAAMFCPPRDDAALSHALDRLMSDPDLKARLGARARERAARYTLSRCADAMEAVYARYCSVPAARQGVA